MPSLPTLPQRTWLERTSLGLAVGLTAIGGLTAAGWWLGSAPLLQPFSSQAALKFNGALILLTIGAALVGFELGRPRLAWVALPGGLLALLSLSQDLLGIDLHIDQFFLRDQLLVATEHPGRISAMLAACLALGSLVLVWCATGRGARSRLLAEAVSGSLLASAGLSTLLGYGAGLPIVYTWGTDTATPPAGAIALCLLGSALLSIAWRESARIEGEAPAWAPMPAVVGCLTLTIILWVGLRAREEAFVSSTTASQMDQFGLQIKDVFDKQASQIERIARAWGDGPPNAFAAWEADSRQLFEFGSGDLGCLTLAFVDLGRRTVWAYPEAGLQAARGVLHSQAPERRAALDLAESTRGPVISTTTTLLAGGTETVKGVVIYSPVIRTGAIVGFAAAEFEYRRFFHQIATTRVPQLHENYDLAVAIGGETVFKLAATDTPLDAEHTLEKTYPIASRRIRVSLTPTDAALRQTRRFLPELALLAGFGITALFGLSVHLARSARAGQRAAEHSNRKLFAENEERRRIEARLKVSDERLRLALDSTQIGIIEWSVPAGHVYYSPGLWAMLGYEHGRMPSTVDTWQSLVHPDDLPLYRRRTEAQLNGLVSFIDPEYRVRARSGDWRWVYTRSKSVAADVQGRPVRIIGTVQDITARREAEQALRESQAEARKLSLVAAKTDNPVLIGSPDGRIEWANEAFCRVMEYSLDEVIGQNPAQFMLGPDTNHRTVARIRGAMARGQGISTDVVNYSKSGRKYQFHIEVQPVRGTNGELENFIAVQTDITARVETEQQLRRAKLEADEASRAKSEFLASMSHEIRTPMNGVIGMTSLLMETSLTAEQRDFVNTIRTSGEALLTIINDILDFSKIESGKMELERTPFDLTLCVEDALDLFALQASSKHLEIGYQIAPEVPVWIMGDVTRLRQVLVNLVNNAVKFTPRGSVSVEIRRLSPPPVIAGAAEDAAPLVLEFRVTDTGIGIPPDRVDRLFKAFSQVDSSTTRKFGGTGLGLAICQRLCELMGGDIRAESVPGQGTSLIFTIRTEVAAGGGEPALPAVPAALARGHVLCLERHPVTAARLRGLFAKWRVECEFAESAATALAAAVRRAPTLLVINAGETSDEPALANLPGISCPRLVLFPFGQTLPPAVDNRVPRASVSKPIRSNAFFQAIVGVFQERPDGSDRGLPAAARPIGEEIPLEVLLAEDNMVNQKVALRFLERLGYRADAVANGLEAVTTLENRRYDLVLMDVQMPEMDGYEATRQIRARLPGDRQPKVIALTANAMQGDRELAFAAGMDDYISKPVKMHEIAAAIRRHFNRAAVPQERQSDG